MRRVKIYSVDSETGERALLTSIIQGRSMGSKDFNRMLDGARESCQIFVESRYRARYLRLEEFVDDIEETK